MEKLPKRLVELAIRDNQDKIELLTKIENMNTTEIQELKKDYEDNLVVLLEL